MRQWALGFSDILSQPGQRLEILLIADRLYVKQKQKGLISYAVRYAEDGL